MNSLKHFSNRLIANNCRYSKFSLYFFVILSASSIGCSDRISNTYSIDIQRMDTGDIVIQPDLEFKDFAYLDAVATIENHDVMLKLGDSATVEIESAQMVVQKDSEQISHISIITVAMPIENLVKKVRGCIASWDGELAAPNDSPVDGLNDWGSRIGAIDPDYYSMRVLRDDLGLAIFIELRSHQEAENTASATFRFTGLNEESDVPSKNSADVE